MKFISKNANLRVVLQPGIPSDRSLGKAAVPGIYVRFMNGLVDIEDSEMIKQMLAHDGFNKDFIEADDVGTDPYLKTRKESEPAHTISELKYGHIEKGYGTKVPIKFTDEQERAVDIMVEQRAQKLLKEVLKISAEKAEADKAEAKEAEDKPEPKAEEKQVEEKPEKKTKSKSSVTKQK